MDWLSIGIHGCTNEHEAYARARRSSARRSPLCLAVATALAVGAFGCVASVDGGDDLTSKLHEGGPNVNRDPLLIPSRKLGYYGLKLPGASACHVSVGTHYCYLKLMAATKEYRTCTNARSTIGVDDVTVFGTETVFRGTRRSAPRTIRGPGWKDLRNAYVQGQPPNVPEMVIVVTSFAQASYCYVETELKGYLSVIVAQSGVGGTAFAEEPTLPQHCVERAPGESPDDFLDRVTKDKRCGEDLRPINPQLIVSQPYSPQEQIQ